MTIIISEKELQRKLEKAEKDIINGNVHTLKEVYQKIQNFRNKKSVCMK